MQTHAVRPARVASRAVLGCLGCLALAGLLIQAEAAGQQARPAELTIDAAGSQVTIDVGRAGVFGFAGHMHEVLAPAVTGRVTVDPANWQHSSVWLEFDASALRVSGKGEPPGDVPEVQRVMQSDRVLDVTRFPVIAFRSREVTATPRGTDLDLVIAGDLTLHGVTRRLVVRATGSYGAGGLTARGVFDLKQTDFGIQPVTAGGGTVRVKDDVTVQFVLRAHATDAAK